VEEKHECLEALPRAITPPKYSPTVTAGSENAPESLKTCNEEKWEQESTTGRFFLLGTPTITIKESPRLRTNANIVTLCQTWKGIKPRFKSHQRNHR
jgi:hypothetical protein